MGYYPYEYFCGANVAVELGGLVVQECAGISYSISEGRMPLYGYSSRHFDAMARGQVLVQGTIVLNYIHQDYLYRIMELGRASALDNVAGNNSLLTERSVNNNGIGEFYNQSPEDLALLTEQYLTDPNSGLHDVPTEMANRFWSPGAGFMPAGVTPVVDHPGPSQNPHDMDGSNSIRITFGDRSPLTNDMGITNLLISGVYFTGRGVPIRIDEEVIVEEYSFLARNIHSIDTGPQPDLRMKSDSPEGEVEIELGLTNPVVAWEGNALTAGGAGLSGFTPAGDNIYQQRVNEASQLLAARSRNAARSVGINPHPNVGTP